MNFHTNNIQTFKFLKFFSAAFSRLWLPTASFGDTGPSVIPFPTHCYRAHERCASRSHGVSYRLGTLASEGEQLQLLSLLTLDFWLTEEHKKNQWHGAWSLTLLFTAKSHAEHPSAGVGTDHTTARVHVAATCVLLFHHTQDVLRWIP